LFYESLLMAGRDKTGSATAATAATATRLTRSAYIDDDPVGQQVVVTSLAVLEI
jgi:hypothetical protein